MQFSADSSEASLPTQILLPVTDRRDRTVREAVLHVDFPGHDVFDIERIWRPERLLLPDTAENAHWNWIRKVRSYRSGYHVFLALEYEGRFEGLAAVCRNPRSFRFAGSEREVCYLDYLESAPWNQAGYNGGKEVVLAGSAYALLTGVILYSQEPIFSGTIGLHSLPQSEEFYRNKLGMNDIGIDQSYENLRYFEWDSHGANEWLKSRGYDRSK